MVAEQEGKAGYLKLQEQASEEMKAKSYVEIDDERIRRKAGPQAATAIEQIWKEGRGILQPETESSSSSNDDGSDYTSDEEEDSDEISYSDYSSDEEDDGDDSEYSSDEEEDDDDDDDDGSSDYSSDEEEDDYDNVGDYWADDEDSNYSTSDDEEDCFLILGDCAMFGFNMVTAMSRAVYPLCLTSVLYWLLQFGFARLVFQVVWNAWIDKSWF